MGTCETADTNGFGNWVHTLLWNTDGVMRDISQELNSSGLDLEGPNSQIVNTLRLVPFRVSSGNPIRIQGGADSQLTQSWIALVPESP